MLYSAPVVASEVGSGRDWRWGIVVMLLACQADEDERGSTPQSQAVPVAVTVQATRAEPWTQTLRSVGVVEAAAEVALSVPSPRRVEAVLVEVGDWVEAGQVVVRLERGRTNLALRQAGGSTAGARVAVSEARTHLARQRGLHARGAIADADLEDAIAGVERAEAAHLAAVAAEGIAARDVHEGVLRAPVAGRVQARHVQPGETAAIGQTLLVLEDLSHLEVSTWISEREIHRIALGLQGEVFVPSPPRAFKARVSRLGTKAHPKTGNFRISLTVDAPDPSMWIGMTVDVELEVASAEPLIRVPRGAIVDEERRRVVYVVDDGVARRREPSFVPSTGSEVPVLHGLAVGEQLVVSGAERLRDGTTVVLTP